jgi:photosystem II stability/assembly factor-like uncharacterized protein
MRRVVSDADGSTNKPPHIFRTRDSGATWQPLSSGFPTKYPFVRPNTLLIDPRYPNVLYLASDCEIDGWCAAGGVYKSMDAGHTWAKLDGPTWPYGLSLDPASPDTLYILDSFHGYGRSDDGGATWIWDRTAQFPYKLVVPDPTDPRRRYGIGLFMLMTTDAGKTWSDASTTLLSGETIPRWFDAVLAADPVTGRVFLGTSTSFGSPGGGLFRSAAGASRWAAIEGTARQAITALNFDAVTGALMIGTPTGLYRSTDLGANWTEIAFARGTAVSRVVPHPQKGGTLYALGLNLLFRTDDYGQSWSRVGAPIPSTASADIATVLAVDAAGDVYVAQLRSPYVWKLSAGSSDWVSLHVSPVVPLPLIASFVIADPAIAGTLYAISGSFFGPSIAVTRDGGSTWMRVETPAAFKSIEPHPSRSGRMFASSTNEIWRTDDGGTSWVRVLSDVLSVSNLSTTAADADVLSFVARDGNVFKATYRIDRTADAGTTWSVVQPMMNDGSAVNFSASANVLVTDPRDSRTMYSLTRTRVIRTDDAGATWHSVSDDLPFQPLSIAIDGAFVHVATERGVWELPLETRRRSVPHR